jgi:hypothetical protein
MQHRLIPCCLIIQDSTIAIAFDYGILQATNGILLFCLNLTVNCKDKDKTKTWSVFFELAMDRIQQQQGLEKTHVAVCCATGDISGSESTSFPLRCFVKQTQDKECVSVANHQNTEARYRQHFHGVTYVDSERPSAGFFFCPMRGRIRGR